MRLSINKLSFIGLFVSMAYTLSACGLADPNQVLVPSDPKRDRGPTAGTSILGGTGGIKLFGSSDEESGSTGSGIGVNSHLWRASLDTISFMPLSSADPFGGVIITDWYSPPETPRERFKLTIFILDRALRADGLRVAVFREERDEKAGTWASGSIDPDTAANLENKILERARQMRTTGIAE